MRKFTPPVNRAKCLRLLTVVKIDMDSWVKSCGHGGTSQQKKLRKAELRIGALRK
jgi:hypothetical protein